MTNENDWYSEWKRLTLSYSEWQRVERVVTIGKTSGATKKNEWQRILISVNWYCGNVVLVWVS